MFEGIISFFRKLVGAEQKEGKSKNAAKERLHLVLIQDRASMSADFLEAMKQEIIEVIKKYIEVDEGAIDVRLTNQTNEDGTNGAPALYANIPITNVKVASAKKEEEEQPEKVEENKNTENEQNNNEATENVEQVKEELNENPEETEKVEVANTSDNN